MLPARNDDDDDDIVIALESSEGIRISHSLTTFAVKHLWRT